MSKVSPEIGTRLVGLGLATFGSFSCCFLLLMKINPHVADEFHSFSIAAFNIPGMVGRRVASLGLYIFTGAISVFFNLKLARREFINSRVYELPLFYRH